MNISLYRLAGVRSLRHVTTIGQPFAGVREPKSEVAIFCLRNGLRLRRLTTLEYSSLPSFRDFRVKTVKFLRARKSITSTGWAAVDCTNFNSINHWPSTLIRLKHTSGSNEDELENREMLLPPLMPFPTIIWPRFINAIRNWFFIHFIIKPYFDKEFSMNEFISGAKEAVSIVANKLSEGKVDELEGLVDSSALVQVKESLSKFTVFQQQLLRVAAEDVFFAFPYQIGIIIPDDPPRDQYAEGVKPPPQSRHVEITVCLHILRGLAERQKSGDTGSAFNFQEFAQDEKNKYNVMICNYRFFKDFTEGSPDPSWIINMVNHFLPAERIRK